MRILLLGSGGREHALAWKISRSSATERLFIAPGNAGTALCGTNVNLSLRDFDGIHAFCVKENIGLVLVGPEEPLVNGIVDFFMDRKSILNIPVIGPSAEGARLEGSKAYAKAFMQRHNIPTAAYREFNAGNYEEGITYLNNHPLPVVLKADGLAAGKGVLICHSREEALTGFEEMIRQHKFGEAGSKVVVEEFLDGIELSVFVLTDGRNYVILPEAKDYKRIGEADSGLNTGGMGAVSPVPFADAAFMNQVEETVIRPTINGLISEQIPYIGFIFIGLIRVNGLPYVIEYNCRMGDPETEVVIPRMKNDLVELLIATAGQKLDTVTLETDTRTACTVVAVSGGYPGAYETGYEIEGLDNNNTGDEDSLVFHAGTRAADGKVLTSGGRVLCVTSFGDTIESAVKGSNDKLGKIRFREMYFRNDIGFEFK